MPAAYAIRGQQQLKFRAGNQVEVPACKKERKRLLQKYMQKPCEVIDRDVQRGNLTDGRSVSKKGFSAQR